MTSTQTIIIDRDTVTTVLDAEEHTRDASRAAIDEIAARVEAELARRGIDGVEVEREYRATGRRSDSIEYHTIMEAVLIGQVDEIRAAVLG